jgi:hypothetical protein
MWPRAAQYKVEERGLETRVLEVCSQLLRLGVGSRREPFKRTTELQDHKKIISWPGELLPAYHGFDSLTLFFFFSCCPCKGKRHCSRNEHAVHWNLCTVVFSRLCLLSFLLWPHAILLFPFHSMVSMHTPQTFYTILVSHNFWQHSTLSVLHRSSSYAFIPYHLPMFLWCSVPRIPAMGPGFTQFFQTNISKRQRRQIAKAEVKFLCDTFALLGCYSA